MSKAIEKMKQMVNKMPECKEKQQARRGVKNLEIFNTIADSFEVIGNIHEDSRLLEAKK